MTLRYLLDASPAQDYVQRRNPAYGRVIAARQTGAKIGIIPPTLGELCGGFEWSDTRHVNMTRLNRSVGDLILWPFDEAAAREYGRLYALLMNIGRAMQQIDMQVAAAALLLGATVVSKDSDLFAVPDLSVEDWSTEVPSP